MQTDEMGSGLLAREPPPHKPFCLIKVSCVDTCCNNVNVRNKGRPPAHRPASSVWLCFVLFVRVLLVMRHACVRRVLFAPVA